MSSHSAILFLTFNRLDTTQRVFEEIQKAQPPRLYLASDGHRAEIPEEKDKVRSVRDYLLSNITWDCKVQTLFRDKNLGCKYAVSSAIDWFFEHEEEGIILEDDCLPSPSFFTFCENLLKAYKNDTRVWHISGDNFQNGVMRGNGDYYFSRYNHVWGWATWRDRWDKYQVDINYDQHSIRSYLKDKQFSLYEQYYWHRKFKKVSKGLINTWDYQYTYSMWCNNALAILPQVNLISNIGFGIEATHTMLFDEKIANLAIHDLEFPLKKPNKTETISNADEFTAKRFGLNSLRLSQIINVFTQFFKKKLRILDK